MANNELFYRVAREGLDDDSTIQELIDDLDAAIESYLTGADDQAGFDIRGEIKHGHAHALVLADNLRAWRDLTAKED